jgi:hypothetical protein
MIHTLVGYQLTRDEEANARQDIAGTKPPNGWIRCDVEPALGIDWQGLLACIDGGLELLPTATKLLRITQRSTFRPRQMLQYTSSY